MRASSLVVATAHTNGIITLEGIDRNEVKIIGASVGSLPGNNYKGNSLSFNIKQGEKGMVALVLYHKYVSGKNSGSSGYEFFLGVKWEEGQEKPYIDLQNQWVPEDPERLGYYYYEDLEVVIDGVTYSCSIHASEKEGKRKVKDANLLCRYMDSKMNAEQLREALDLPAKEQSVREELAQAQIEVARLNGLSETYREQLSAKILEYGWAVKDRDRWKAKADQTETWMSVARQLKTAVEEQWFVRKSVALALKAFPIE